MFDKLVQNIILLRGNKMVFGKEVLLIPEVVWVGDLLSWNGYFSYRKEGVVYIEQRWGEVKYYCIHNTGDNKLYVACLYEDSRHLTYGDKKVLAEHIRAHLFNYVVLSDADGADHCFSEESSDEGFLSDSECVLSASSSESGEEYGKKRRMHR